MRLSDSIITAISALKHPDKRNTIALARSLKGKTGIEIGGPSGFFKQKAISLLTYMQIVLTVLTLIQVRFGKVI
ncbi:hypothetical protein [Niabella ginsengisoli]|uniref:Uncharacterized protein n=1 Tax=Niabella ginsengisoli TaxID=522298 RepID=A0ABS9SEP9_9BACT|nr:hypothetical protein [Niabella ginsengisoli]MCH5596834.1 hypothetical protein [Niabella ginsengisoli]